MQFDNEMKLTVKAMSINEGFSRSTVAAFAVQLNPTLDQINDIKTAVSEAVTNSIVHAYPDRTGDITIHCGIENKTLHIAITDYGDGIANLEQAKKPFFTTKPEQERSGMGFTVMESFMDSMEVQTSEEGTTVRLSKVIGDK